MKVFGNYAPYYDLLYRDKNYAGEARYVHSLIQKHNPGAKSLLELGCGTGAHAQCLADLGYELHGVDSSEEMLNRAQCRLSGMKQRPVEKMFFSLGDLRSVRLPGRFDAVISLFHVMSYQVANTDLQSAFTTAREHLTPGGIFIFDCWYGPAVLTEKPTVRIKRLEDNTVSVTRIAEPIIHPADNIVDVNYTVFIKEKASNRIVEIKETHRMRYLFPSEIEDLLSSVGFEMIHYEEWMSGKIAGLDTWNVCFLARA